MRISARPLRALALGSLLALVFAAGTLTAARSQGVGDQISLLPVILRPPSLVTLPVGQGFSQVTAITHAGDERLFIAQRNGEVMELRPDGSSSPYLDLSDRVITDGSEYGLFHLAFHPEFGRNGFLFVTYTARIDKRVYLLLSRFHEPSGGATADPASEAVLLRIRQDTDLHKGGGLDFDRRNNWLYIGIGEDTQIALAQDPDSPKGKVWRVAVDDVPPDLTGNAEGRARMEMWAMGFRNPWRVDVDEPSGTVYVADVGSGAWEEINGTSIALTGSNFGWPCREGPDLYPPGADVPACQLNPQVVGPLYAYYHDSGRCAIIGGHVYRPATNPADGRYVFGDLCTRELFAFPTGTSAADPAQPLGLFGQGALTTLGEDAAGNLYAGSANNSGPIYKLILP